MLNAVSSLKAETLAAILLALLGMVQIVLSFLAAKKVQNALRRIESPAERNSAAHQLWRPVYAFRVLAFLSFAVAASSLAIPLYLHGRYGM